MEEKIQKLIHRYEAVESELVKPEVLQDQGLYRKLTQEHAYLSDIKNTYEKIQKIKQEISDNRELFQLEEDPKLQEDLQNQTKELEGSLEKAELELETLLVPPDPTDHRNTIVELRAGTGGDEAALFVGNCVRMYKLYAEREGWNYELLSCTPSEIGGFKEYIMVLSGKNVYRFMKYEAGTHRVQRVPETETQGRVHTSAITVAVLAEPEEDEAINIEEKDLRIDTFRASGAGGQHVNVTDSAVRITHIPTGFVVSCQEERSQHKNKEKALRVLAAELAEAERAKKIKEQADTRSLQVGTGDRSGRIRTYNFPQNRITDHRINFTRHNLQAVMEGDLSELSSALVAYDYQQKLSG